MTLPVSYVRPASEPASPAATNDMTHRAVEPARTFGHALSSALHEPSESREAAMRRSREAKRDVAHGGESADERRIADVHAREVRAMRDDNAPREATHESPREAGRESTRDSANDRRESAPRDASESARSVRGASERSTDARIDARRDAKSNGREPGTTFVGTPGARTSVRLSSANDRSASRDADDTAGATGDATPDASGAATSFVEQPLDAAVAPLPPLTLVAGNAAAVAGAIAGMNVTATNGSPSAATPAATTATTTGDSAITIDERVIDEAASAARRLVLEGTSARDPLAVNKEMEGLAPELRARLERVIDRMEQEYGYTVQVVETTRSQERQDALYAQGRTAPGDVVTWTRNSRHLAGNAADVVIDGGYGNSAGFERLARVARQEGLRTLWPRDPGHIELVGSGSSATRQAPPPDLAPRLVRGAEGDIHIVPLGVDESLVPAIPKAMRSAIDPSATPPLQGVRNWVPGNERGVHILPTTPNGDAPHILPFPTTASPNVPVDASREEGVRGTIDNSALTTRTLVAPAATGTPGFIARVAGVASVAGVAGVAAPATVAPVAQVAPVAHVATVAQVAQVASVAAVGGGAAVDAARADDAGHGAESTPLPAGAPNATPGNSRLAPAPVIANDGEQRHGASGERRSSSERGERDRTEGVLAAHAAPAEGDAAKALAAHDGVTTDRGERASSASPVAGLTRSDATERIARVLRIQEAANDRPMSSVLLRLDAPDGGEDRIRIDLRGHSVGTTLDIADPQAAAELRSRVPELQQALQRQGLEGESMVVRTSSRSTDASVLTASAVAAERDVARAASATASDGGGSTARDSRNPPRAFERDGTDQQRSRQRRDGKGDRR